jgi:hypothetical protein
MLSRTCPCCGEAALHLQEKAKTEIAYCQFCGWNVARAQELLAFQRRAVYQLLVVLAVPMAIGLAFPSDRLHALEDSLLISALFAFLFVLLRRRLAKDSRKLAEVRTGGDGAYVRQRVVPQADAETLGHLNYVRSLRWPRQVQFNQPARLARIVTQIFPVGMWLFGAHDLLFPNHPIGLAAHGPTEARIWATVMLVCGTVTWSLLRRLFQNKREFSLLKEGQVALGRVVGSIPGLVRRPGIKYEFRDTKDELVLGEAPNVGGTFNEDSYVLVFYDPRRPENSTALGATNYELAADRADRHAV